MGRSVATQENYSWRARRVRSNFPGLPQNPHPPCVCCFQEFTLQLVSKPENRADWNNLSEAINIWLTLLKLSKSIIFNVFRKREFFILGLHLKQKLDKTLMHNSYSPRAFKWLSAPEKACAEFYYHQIADKFSLKLPRCITNIERFKLYRLVCCFFGPCLSA